MRFTFIALTMLSSALCACAAPAPAMPAAPVTAARGTPSVDWVSIGDLMANPRSKAVLVQDLPGFCKSKRTGPAMAMTLQDIGPFSGGVIDDAKLSEIQRDLNSAYASKAAVTPLGS